MQFTVNGARVLGEFTPTELHVGFAGLVHGGILAAVLDDALAWLGYYHGQETVTARLAIRYRHPARPGHRLRVEAEELSGAGRGRMRQGRAVLRADDGTVIAEAEATMLPAPANV